MIRITIGKCETWIEPPTTNLNDTSFPRFLSLRNKSLIISVLLLYPYALFTASQSVLTALSTHNTLLASEHFGAMTFARLRPRSMCFTISLLLVNPLLLFTPSHSALTDFTTLMQLILPFRCLFCLVCLRCTSLLWFAICPDRTCRHRDEDGKKMRAHVCVRMFVCVSVLIALCVRVCKKGTGGEEIYQLALPIHTATWV